MPSVKPSARCLLVDAFQCHIKVSIVISILFAQTNWPMSYNGNYHHHEPHGAGPSLMVEAVAVQRLKVPSLVVIDQLNQPQHQARIVSIPIHQGQSKSDLWNNGAASGEPEAASLTNGQDHLSKVSSLNNESQPITFECLISFDKRKDKNLIVKWHHDDRVEPIYQWIPELNKRSIAPQYRAYISPITSSGSLYYSQTGNGQDFGLANGSQSNNQSNQLLEAGFQLLRPSKELGGKYTCSAISAQNDDSKWKKMIVYTPPSSFRFNATRTDISILMANRRDRLIQPSMIGPQMIAAHGGPPMSQLAAGYRIKQLDGHQTTISPQMFSTIDYVNLNQQRVRQYPPATSPWLITRSPQSLTGRPSYDDQASRTTDTIAGSSGQTMVNKMSQMPSGYDSPRYQHANGVKLICDIDQVFPVPEVSIYRLAKLDGSHPDKLDRLDTQIEMNPVTGLYHVQVTSILEDDELQMKYGLNEPVYFECLIALTNLELGKYSDNKRSLTYRPGLLSNSQLSAQQSNGGSLLEPVSGNAAISARDLVKSIWIRSAFLASHLLMSSLIYYLTANKLFLG